MYLHKNSSDVRENFTTDASFDKDVPVKFRKST